MSSTLSFSNKRSAGQMSITGMGCCSTQSDNSTAPLKTRKLKNSRSFSSSTSSHSSSLSPTSSSSTNGFRFITLPRRRSASPESTIPVLSPCTYMTISLKNKKIKTRVDSFSLEQALYFEPYQESEIHIELLKALRGADLEKIRSLVLKEQEQNKGDNSDSTGDGDNNDNDNAGSPFEELVQARNQFGENLVHLACRMGMSGDMLKFLVEDAKVPLNVRDRFGRTPLHNACMSSLPNFDNIDFVMRHAPKLVIFEDDKNNIPFELVPQRCFERWTRFLSEENILQKVSAELAKHDGLLQKT